MPTLFERIGGDAAVNAAVDRFYEIVLADDRIKGFFANTDMTKQRTHQKAFLKYAFGGLPNYPGRNMRAAHAGLALNDHHFDAVLDDLRTALTDLKVPVPMISEVIATAETTRTDVLNR